MQENQQEIKNENEESIDFDSEMDYIRKLKEKLQKQQ